MAKINIESKISAPIERVWNEYTLPEHIVQWNFASAEWCCPSAENDLRVGGEYWARMEAKDGSWGFDFEAVYDEVVVFEKFSYTMTDGRLVQVSFSEEDGHTLIMITFDAEDQNSIELQRDGWKAILDNFKKYVER